MLVNGQIEVESVNGKISEFSEDIEIVEEILRRYHGDSGLQVIDIQCSPGSKDGDNYMSLIKRIVAKIKSTKTIAGECVSVCGVCIGIHCKKNILRRSVITQTWTTQIVLR